MRASLAALVAAMALMPQAALAAGPGSGVHVDPGSPAGKQYSFPISSARSEAAGGQSGSGAPPMFGAGITPGSTRSAGAGGARAGTSAGTSSSPAGNAGATSSRHVAKAVHRRRGHSPSAAVASASENHSPAPADVGVSSWLPLVVGGGLVLVLGCGGGLALRRGM